jgi:hypothetical protein
MNNKKYDTFCSLSSFLQVENGDENSNIILVFV